LSRRALLVAPVLALTIGPATQFTLEGEY
jgi:iron complex outermembrane receptor protein